MSKKLPKDEIDLVDIFLIVWKQKMKISIFISLGFLFAYAIILTTPPVSIDAKSEIKFISVYDEAKYRISNSILDTIKPFYSIEKQTGFKGKQFDQDGTLKTSSAYDEYSGLSKDLVWDLQIVNIDKVFLRDLFVDTIGDKYFLINLIKKFSLIKEDDYSNKVEYEKAINKLLYSIKTFKNNKDQFYIEIKDLTLDNWEEFLQFLETETNIAIQEKLSNMFSRYIQYVESIRAFQMEDIETQLSLIDNENDRISLEKRKSIMFSNKYAERMQFIFNSSPISSQDNFYAAKIDYNLTNYEFNGASNTSPIITFLVSGILGAIIGIFFVLIANAIQNRK